MRSSARGVSPGVLLAFMLALGCSGRVESPVGIEGGAPMTAPYVGYVSVSSGGSATYQIGASFFTPDAQPDRQRFTDLVPPSPSCQAPDVAAGPCCYSPGWHESPRLTYASAGLIRVTGADGRLVASMSEFPYDGTTPTDDYYQYLSPPTMAARWTPGDVLGVSAPGGAVHAFSGSVQTMRAIVGVTPALSGLPAPLVVDRSLDFVVSWTPDSSGPEQVSLALSLNSGKSGRITCVAADAAGRVALPSQLLGNLSATDGADVLLERSLTSRVGSDNASVDLRSVAFVSAQATFK